MLYKKATISVFLGVYSMRSLFQVTIPTSLSCYIIGHAQTFYTVGPIIVIFTM